MTSEQFVALLRSNWNVSTATWQAAWLFVLRRRNRLEKSVIVSNRIFNTGTLLLALCNGNINHVMTKDFLHHEQRSFPIFGGSKWVCASAKGRNLNSQAAAGSKTPPWGRFDLFGADNGKIYRRRSVACHKIKTDACTTLFRVSFSLSVTLFGQKTSVKL